MVRHAVVASHSAYAVSKLQSYVTETNKVSCLKKEESIYIMSNLPILLLKGSNASQRIFFFNSIYVSQARL